MNDILAPIFAVFLAEKFSMTYVELENRIRDIEGALTSESLLDAEADAFFVFSLLLAQMKQNYLKGFDGVTEMLQKFRTLVAKCDKELLEQLENNDIQVFHFGFRWIFCLLLREFPVLLSIKLIDYYLVEDVSPSELCVYLAATLLLKFSCKIKTLKREQIIMFLQNLPTANWGEQDIKLLVSEAFTLRNLFRSAD